MNEEKNRKKKRKIGGAHYICATRNQNRFTQHTAQQSFCFRATIILVLYVSYINEVVSECVLYYYNIIHKNITER